MTPLETSPLFIGLVTHPKTRFKHSQTTAGVARRLEAELKRRGLNACTVICSENLCNSHINGYTSARSKIAQKIASIHWHYYLHKKIPSPAKLVVTLLRTLADACKDLFSRKAQASTLRLINIELAHLWLMRQAIKSMASWAIIIEDDASCENIEDLTDGLLGMIKSPHKPSYINLSLSFTPQQLNAENILHVDPDFKWNGTTLRSIMRATVPITNTVCAVAYEASFLSNLLQIIEDMGTFPVLPIDWKVNMGLIKLHHSKSPANPYRGCLFVEPGPLIQGSLHQSL
jgi:hypothetical protein